MPTGAKILYDSAGYENTLLFSIRPGAVGGTNTGTILKWGAWSKYIYIARNTGKGINSWESSDWEKISAGYADSSGNADTVDGQHFNWNNDKNDHTYLWAASSNGQAYLVHRASISVNYATIAS